MRRATEQIEGDGAHRHAHQRMADAARFDAKDERVVDPFVLDVFLLVAVGDRDRDRIVARRQQRQVEFETRPRDVAGGEREAACRAT